MCILSRLKQFTDHCFSLRIMVLLGTMLLNYSVPCHKGDGGNTLATRYNHVLGRQANLRESSESKELAKLRLQVLVVVITSDACESKKEIMRLRE